MSRLLAKTSPATFSSLPFPSTPSKAAPAVSNVVKMDTQEAPRTPGGGAAVRNAIAAWGTPVRTRATSTKETYSRDSPAAAAAIVSNSRVATVKSVAPPPATAANVSTPQNPFEGRTGSVVLSLSSRNPPSEVRFDTDKVLYQDEILAVLQLERMKSSCFIWKGKDAAMGLEELGSQVRELEGLCKVSGTLLRQGRETKEFAERIGNELAIRLVSFFLSQVSCSRFLTNVGKPVKQGSRDKFVPLEPHLYLVRQESIGITIVEVAMVSKLQTRSRDPKLIPLSRHNSLLKTSAPATSRF